MKSIETRDEGQQGFSLLETLFAVAIFSVGVIAVAGLFLVNIKQNASAEDITKASVMAQDKLEEILDLNYNTLIAGGDVGSIATSETGYFDYPELEYLRRWEIDVDAPVVDMTTIRVNVSSSRILIGSPKDCTLVITRTR